MENYQPPAQALDPEQFKEWHDTIFPHAVPTITLTISSRSGFCAMDKHWLIRERPADQPPHPRCRRCKDKGFYHSKEWEERARVATINRRKTAYEGG